VSVAIADIVVVLGTKGLLDGCTKKKRSGRRTTVRSLVRANKRLSIKPPCSIPRFFLPFISSPPTSTNLSYPYCPYLFHFLSSFSSDLVYPFHSPNTLHTRKLVPLLLIHQRGLHRQPYRPWVCFARLVTNEAGPNSLKAPRILQVGALFLAHTHLYSLLA